MERIGREVPRGRLPATLYLFLQAVYRNVYEGGSEAWNEMQKPLGTGRYFFIHCPEGD